MSDDVFSIALSGVHAAATRQAASAHNVANLTTEEFRPLRTEQSAREGGGVDARVVRAREPRPVDLPREVIEQLRARAQLQASLRVADAPGELTGRLVDLLA